MILYPMVISAAAVVVTLIYASYLDIRDRRVPFRTWYPMLIIGIPATGVLLFQSTGSNGQPPNYSLIAGYLALIASFFYANYLDSREANDRFAFHYLATVLILPALSWFVLPKMVNLQLVPWYAMFAGIIGYISYLAYRNRPGGKTGSKKKKRKSDFENTMTRWYFVAIISVFVITAVTMLVSGEWGAPALVVLLTAAFSGVFYIFGRMHLFGGADAWALIFIAFCIPAFPFTPILNISPLGFLAFSALINALLLNLITPVAIFIINLVKGNRAPLMYMFFGFPVEGTKIRESWGFVMEEFEEKKGVMNRRFIGFWDSIHRMYSGKGRVYTKDLRENPENFSRELAIYRSAGTVWISYAVPFIIPITAGLISALVFGDLLLAIIKIITGGV